MAARCRKCGKGALEIRGYLRRMNETGVDGIWECRPACGADMSPDDSVVCAILDDEDYWSAGAKEKSENGL